MHGQPGAHQQAGCRQRVQCGVMANVVTAGGKATPAARPVHGGFKTGYKMRTVAGCRPGVFGLLHQLGVGHQHHRMRRMRLPPGHLLADAGDHRRPCHRRMMFFGYVIHSFSVRQVGDAGPRPRENARYRDTAGNVKRKERRKGGRPQPLVSVTISPLYLYLTLHQGIHHGQRTHQTCL